MVVKESLTEQISTKDICEKIRKIQSPQVAPSTSDIWLTYPAFLATVFCTLKAWTIKCQKSLGPFGRYY
jgi:hypothetical protein